MNTVTLQELLRDAAAVVARVEAGEVVYVTRPDGRPIVEMRPPRRPFGLARGKFAVPDDFDAPLPEDILRDFEGR